MKYRLPVLEDEALLKEYVEEHYANNENTISASVNLISMNFAEWVEKVNRNSTTPDDEWGKYYMYLAFNDDDQLIGLLNIRFDLADSLKEEFGEIGYGVRPSERRKGYATQMLKDALEICKEKNMKEVILGCFDDNIGSNKTILNNQGVLYKNDDKNVLINGSWNIDLKRNYYKITL